MGKNKSFRLITGIILLFVSIGIILSCVESGTTADVVKELSYTSSTLTAVVGTAITTLSPTTTPSGATGTYSISPSLPAGLSLDTATGDLSGTPTAAAAQETYTVTFTASGNYGSTQTATLTIEVKVPDTAVSYGSSTLTATVNTAITTLSPTTTPSGATGTYSISPDTLNADTGLSFSTTTGEISGTPTKAMTTAKTYTITFTASGNYSGAPTTTLDVTVFLVLETVFVEGGSFRMGSTDSDADPNESPVHDVTVSSFYMAKTEVTQGQWKAVMGDGTNPSVFTGDDLPVETITWYKAVEFCNKLSVKEGLEEVYTINEESVTADFDKNGWRLPTEAEWEYAARGGKLSQSYKYSGSDTVGDVGWYRDNSRRYSKTNPVGEKGANELGLYDMSGHVWEWCWDLYWDNYYSNSPVDNPRGPSIASRRVVRGGSWFSSARHLRSANRDGSRPSGSGSHIGFRPVRRT